MQHDEGVSYPCSLVWGYLPLITTIFPFIGHMGITDSKGTIYDFQGPYYISKGRFMTGSVFMQFKLDVKSDDIANQDQALKRASMAQRNEMQNLFWNNCHNFAGKVLQEYNQQNYDWPSMVDVWFMVFRMSWNGISKFAIVWIPWIIIVGLIFQFNFLK